MSQAQAAPPAQRSGLFGRLWSGKVRGRGCPCSALHALLSRAGITQRCAPPRSPDRARRAPGRLGPACVQLYDSDKAARYLCVPSNPCLRQPRSLRARAAQGAAEGRKKPVKAKLGEKNTMFYDEEVRPGPGAPVPVAGLCWAREARQPSGRGAGTAACLDRPAARCRCGNGAGA